MSTTDAAVFAAALALPESLRADLAAQLLDSLGDDAVASTMPDALAKLIGERCGEVDRGEAEIMDGEVAIAKLREISIHGAAKP